MNETTRTVLVTGAGHGIGHEIALSFAEDGHRVVAVDMDGDAVRRLSEDSQRPNVIVPLVGDVTDEQFWDRELGAVTGDIGGIEVLVNNAGVSPKHDGKKLMGTEMPLSEWQRVVDINLTGVFLGIRAVANTMCEAGWGRVINMSSMAGRTRARVAGVHYGATKAAVLGLTRAFAGEVGPHGVTVNSVAPGRIRTAMMGDGNSETDLAMLSDTPTGRFGTPADICATVRFLASDGASYINGAVIDVNGGALMI